MPQNQDEWPTHVEELARKTSEQLEKWMTAYDRGAISKREFYIAVSALYDATSGLIPKDLMDIMADTCAELRNKPS